jgi:hypothetical protein
VPDKAKALAFASGGRQGSSSHYCKPRGKAMTTVTREQISVAFFDLIKGAASFTAGSRRFVHWDQVNETQMPYLTMLKTGEVRGRQSEGLPTLTINAHVFVYLSAGMDPEDTPDTAMNTLLDAIDTVVAPSGAAALSGNKQTLGGLVAHCYPFGPVFVDTGDIDGKAVAAIPFQILVP